LNNKLRDDSMRRQREKEYKALSGRLKIEAAEIAYDEWLEVKESPMPSSPSACEERLVIRSRASHKSCTTCTSSSKTQSAKSRSPRVHSQIKIKPHQEMRNTKPVGKPSKLYPYTNYPAKHLRTKGSSNNKSKQCARSSRRSQTIVSRTEHVVVKPMKEDLTAIQNMCNEPLQSEAPSVRDECSDDDDMLFHDVGHANNLDSLALPNVLTKDRTQGELIKLLRTLEEPKPRTFNRSRSMISRRNVQSGRLQRRLSLSAIPEGRIVTSYSDEDQSVPVSQLLDDSFIEELIKTFSQSPSGEHSPQRVVQDGPTHKGELDTVRMSSTRRPSLSLPVSRPDELTLKVVNIEWDNQSNGVHSVITTSPLSTHPDKRRTPSPRNSPTTFIPLNN